MEWNVVWLRGFLILLLIVFNFTLVHCEDNPLDSVPISLLKFQPNLNRSVSCNESMKEARTCYVCVCPDSQEIIFPQVKTFVIQGNNESICLTNTSQEIRPHCPLQDKIMNFTNCAVVSASCTLTANPLNYSFNSSCALLNHFAHPPNATNQLALAVWTCPKLSQGKKYCLVFVPSKLRNNLSNVCPSGRILHGLPASPLPVSSVSSVTHSTTSQPIKTSIFDKFIAFIKNRPVLFSAIVAVVFVVMIVIVAICCWRCYKRKKHPSNFELEPLPPTEDDKKASAESVVYQEPFIHTFVPGSEIEQSTEDYDYPYSHRVRGIFGNKIPDKKKLTESDYENSSVVDEKEREYTSLRRSGSEANEPEYQRLQTRTQTQASEIAMT